jgi:hypothetical protein
MGYAWVSFFFDIYRETRKKREMSGKMLRDEIYSQTSYQELGKHYRRVGDLANAHRAFSKAREHATNALHAAELSLASLDLALDAENFKLAHSNAAKAQAGLDSLLGSLELKPNGTKNKPAAGSSLQLSSLPSDPKDPFVTPPPHYYFFFLGENKTDCFSLGAFLQY